MYKLLTLGKRCSKSLLLLFVMHMPNMVHGRLAPGKIVPRKIAPYANPNHNPNPYLGGICFGEIFRCGGVGNFPVMSEYNLIRFQL